VSLATVGVVLALPPEAVALRTGGTGCYLSFAEGQLLEDPESGTAVLDGGGRHPVIWPTGYTARRWFGEVEVLDRHAHVVARTGDRVHLSGGYDDMDDWLVCGLEPIS
jgi:hypothetical protein